MQTAFIITTHCRDCVRRVGIIGGLGDHVGGAEQSRTAESMFLLYPQTGQAGCGCGVYRFGQKNSTLITLASTGAIYRRNT